MEATEWSAAKEKALWEQGLLNPHPERVRDELFERHVFFDARDLVQVRYEMVRRVLVEGQPMGKTAAAFGYVFDKLKSRQLAEKRSCKSAAFQVVPLR